MGSNKGKKLWDLSLIIVISLLIILSKRIIIVRIWGIISIAIIIHVNKRRKKELIKKEKEIKERARRYIMAIEAMNGSVWEWDEKSDQIYISNMISDLLGLKSNYIKRNKWYEYVIEEDRERVKRQINNICLNRVKINLTLSYRVKDKYGDIKYITYRGEGKENSDIFYFTGVISDVTEKKKQDRVIKENFEKYKQVLEGSNDIVFCWKIKDGVITFNSKVKKYIDVEDEGEEATLLHNEWLNIIYFEDKDIHDTGIRKILENPNEKFYELEYRILTKDNKIRWVNIKGKKVDMEDKELYIYGTLSDITDRKQSEMEIQFMSYYDEVTGIPNRRYFTAELERAIKNCNEYNTKVALVFIDLDNFKNINDTYGHYVGDIALRAICEKIYDGLSINHILARFGGDEFAIIMENIKDTSEIRESLNHIINTFKIPLKIQNKEIYCAFSVGVSIYPDYSNSMESLLKHADMAMYKAKANGKNRYEFFQESILNSMNREFEIEKFLRKALEEDELYLNFQPKVSLDNNKIDGFEILIRWDSKKLGKVPPNQFIPIAESSGMIIDIGKFIIDKSLKYCKELSLATNEKFHFAINISDIQLRDEDFVDYISKGLKRYDISPEYIEFEITESIIMKSVSKNIDTLLKLKELGVTIALDDFGTGYSSLNYLRRLPIDVLKIDKSFIDGIGLDEKSDYIAKSIIELSHNLNLKVVAEGVETKEQLNYLSHINCDIIQGYYFSKPKEFKNIKEMILSE